MEAFLFAIHLRMKFLYPILLIALIFGSCAKKKAEKQAKADDEIIKEYIASHGLSAVKTESGLYVAIENPGTGAACNSYATVRASYKGYFTDGEVFDSSSAAGIEFDLQGVIEGWTEGIPYFKEGGNGILLIPSALGYGKNGNSTIPGNTVIIFDVKLLEVL
jgi:FKBP-type peptidyl-prolyl cis-trans isomerase FkpA